MRRVLLGAHRRHRLWISNHIQTQYALKRNIRYQEEEFNYLRTAHWPNIKNIDLSFTTIGSFGAKMMSKASWPQLTTLKLENCLIDAEGAKYLSEADWKYLQTLSLKNNNLGNEGATYISRGRWIYLSCLDLDHNEIDGRGLAEISLAKWPYLRQLKLGSNNMEQNLEIKITLNFEKLAILHLCKADDIVDYMLSIFEFLLFILSVCLNSRMLEVCGEHCNKIQRICLQVGCSNRSMCLLCDHLHGQPFQSIMQKKSEDYRRFEQILDSAVDRYFYQIRESDEEKIKHQQITIIRKYFQDIRQTVSHFIDHTEDQVIKRFASDQHQNFSIIKKARINQNYVRVPQHIFALLLKVYEGTSLADLFRSDGSFKAEIAHAYMSDFHTGFASLSQKMGFKIKTKLPDIRLLVLEKSCVEAPQYGGAYEMEEQNRKKLGAVCRWTSTCEFGSIISDALKSGDQLMTTSYDKKIRLMGRGGVLQGELEFGNVLTKIQRVADQVFALGCSKEILVQKIWKIIDNEWKAEQLMRLRGHKERVNDLHLLNSRIIGSSSAQGVKLWDLYKQKCEFTLKQEAAPTAIRFLPGLVKLAVGFDNHQLKVYSVQTMKSIQRWKLEGVPLFLDQGRLSDHVFYAGGFPSQLAVLDLRLTQAVWTHNFEGDGITCLVEPTFDQNTLILGDRNGQCSILDARTRKIRVDWQAHQSKTNISRPRGIVKLFEEAQCELMSVGCNDRTVKLWEILPQ